MEKAVFGTGVEGFLKTKLREVGALGGSYNTLNHRAEKVGRPSENILQLSLAGSGEQLERRRRK